MTTYTRTFAIAFTSLLFLLPSVVRAAVLNISPASVSVGAGASFTETVFVSSTAEALNAVSGTLSFPTDVLQVTSVSKANSVLTLWVAEPTFSNIDGTVSFSGIVPNPGYTGSRGQVFSVQFRAKRAGTAMITFAPSSQVLANDGSGTDILTTRQSASISVGATQPQVESPVFVPVPISPSVTKKELLAHIISSTHPDETQWYKLSHVIFDWTNAQGVSAVRLGYDKDADGIPSVVYTDPISHKELDLDDGIWYFHVQEKDTSGWGPVSTYKIQIDTVAPRPFPILFLNGTTTVSFSSTMAIQFMALDDLSGIDHYQLAVDGKETTVSAEEGSKPYAVTGDSAGNHILSIRAYDKAGNTTGSEGIFSVVGGTQEPSPIFTLGWQAANYLTLILIVVAILGTLLFGAWYIHTHFSAYRRRLNHRLSITQTHIHKEFDTLKDAITGELMNLERAKSERELTREETRLISRFKKLLDRSEEEIEKDLGEIST